MTTTLEINPRFDQPYSLHYRSATGSTVGAPSELNATSEIEAREELAEDYGYTAEQIEKLFNGEKI